MKQFSHLCVHLLACVFLTAFAQSGESMNPEAQGLAIAQEASRRNEGYGDTAVDLTMELISADGRTRERTLSWQMLESTDPDDGDKALTIFHEPRDIAGTGFLSHTHITREDDQWLYLPSLKRVKRIASANKSSSFVGSEFAYEDLLSDEVEKFSYRWLTDEPCGEWVCFVVERIPVYENSGYSREVVWIDQVDYRIYKTEFYDLKGALEKILYFEKYQQYLDKFWRAQMLRMENVQTGKATILTFTPYVFQTGLTEQAFSPAALKRIR
jgi:outer membrane lipoprotein-sorting protein